MDAIEQSGLPGETPKYVKDALLQIATENGLEFQNTTTAKDVARGLRKKVKEATTIPKVQLSPEQIEQLKARKPGLIESLKTATEEEQRQIVRDLVAIDEQLKAAGETIPTVETKAPSQEVTEEEYLAGIPKLRLLKTKNSEGKPEYVVVTEEEFQKAPVEEQQESEAKTFSQKQSDFIDDAVDNYGTTLTSADVTKAISGDKKTNAGVIAEYRRRMKEKYPAEVVKAPSKIVSRKDNNLQYVRVVESTRQSETRKAIADIVGDEKAAALLKEANSTDQVTTVIKNRPRFTNSPSDVITWIDSGETVVVPDSVVETEKVHPRIKVKFNSTTNRYEVESVRHPKYGEISKEGQFTALDSKRATKASEAAMSDDYTLNTETAEFMKELQDLNGALSKDPDKEKKVTKVWQDAYVKIKNYTESAEFLSWQKSLEADDINRIQNAALQKAVYDFLKYNKSKISVKTMVKDYARQAYQFREVRKADKLTAKESARGEIEKSRDEEDVGSGTVEQVEKDTQQTTALKLADKLAEEEEKAAKKETNADSENADEVSAESETNADSENADEVSAESENEETEKDDDGNENEGEEPSETEAEVADLVKPQEETMTPKGQKGEVYKALVSQLDPDQLQFLSDYDPATASASDTERFNVLIEAGKKLRETAEQAAQQSLIGDPRIRNLLIREGYTSSEIKEMDIAEIQAIVDPVVKAELLAKPEVQAILKARNIASYDIRQMSRSRLETILADEAAKSSGTGTLKSISGYSEDINSKTKKAVAAAIQAARSKGEALRTDAKQIEELRIVEESGALVVHEPARLLFPATNSDGAPYITDINSVLNKLARTTKDPRIKALATYLSGVGLTANIMYEENLTDSEQAYLYGEYNPNTGLIKIRHPESSSGTFPNQQQHEETVIHEAIHALTQSTIAFYNWYKKQNDIIKAYDSQVTGVEKPTRKKYNEAKAIIADARAKKYTSVAVFGEEMDRLYAVAKAFWDGTDATKQGSLVRKAIADSAQRDGFNGLSYDKNTEHTIKYGLENVDEFTAALAHPAFRTFLNNIQDPGTTMTVWNRVMQSIRKLFFGLFNIQENSVLDSALIAITNINTLVVKNTTKEIVETYKAKEQARLDKLVQATLDSALGLESANTLASIAPPTNIITTLGSRPSSTPKATTSLEELRKNVPAVDAALKGKVYLSEATDDNRKAVNDHIAAHNTLDEAYFAIDLTSSNLTDREKLLAKVTIGTYLSRVSQALMATDKVQAEYYDELAFDAYNKVSESLTRYAQGLQMGKEISQMLSPAKQAAKLTNPVSTAQVSVLKGEVNVTAINTEIATAQAEAAITTVNKATEAVKASVKGEVTEELQNVFDFFNQVYSTDKIDENLIKKIAERLVKLAKSTLDKAPLSERQKLEKEVMKEVISQLSSLVTTKNATKPFELRDILLNNLDLTKRAYDNAVNTLLQFGRLSPEKAQAVKDAVFVDYNYKAAKDILFKQLNLSNELRKTLAQRNSTLTNVVNTILTNSDLSQADAKRIAEALEKVYNAEVKKAATARLKALSADPEFKKSRVQNIPADSKFLELIQLGAFDEKELYNRIALANPKLKLPSWNPAMVQQIKKEAAIIQQMPEGDAKRERIIKLDSMIAEEHAKNLTGVSYMKYWLGDVAPAIWQAGVLSGVPTQAVNFVSSHANVGLQGLFQAMGYQVTSLAKGETSFADSFVFYKNVISSWFTVMNFFDSACSGNLIFKKGLIDGSSRFKNLDAGQRSILEQYKYLPHKYVGRVMTAADGVNCQLGTEIAMRNALTYAFMKQGKRGEQLAQALAEAYDPNVTVKADIEAQIEHAASQGFLGTGSQLERNKGIMRIELMEKYRQEMAANDKLIESSTESAKDWTFNNDPKGIMGLVFEGVSSTLNKQVKVTKFILPFMRTMSNLVNNALDFSVFGVLRAHNISPGSLLLSEKNKYRLRSVDFGSVEYATLMAQGVVGTGMMMALMAMAWKGMDDEDEGKEPSFAIYGSGPSDFQKAKQLEQGSAWRKNSMRIGGYVLRYTDWPLLSLALGAIGAVCDMRRYEKNLNEKSVADQAKLFGLGIVNVIFEKNLISGLSNVMDVIRNPDARGAMALEKFSSGIVGGFLNPQALKWSRTTLEGLTSPEGRSPVYDRSTTWGYWMSMTPMSGWGNQPMLNTLGQPITQPWHQSTTGRFISMESKTNPIFSALVDKGLFIKSPSKTTKMKIGRNEFNVGKTDETWRTFIELRGAELQRRLSPAFLSSLSNLSKEKAQDRLDKVTGLCRENAVNKLRRMVRNNEITL